MQINFLLVSQSTYRSVSASKFKMNIKHKKCSCRAGWRLRKTHMHILHDNDRSGACIALLYPGLLHALHDQTQVYSLQWITMPWSASHTAWSDPGLLQALHYYTQVCLSHCMIRPRSIPGTALLHLGLLHTLQDQTQIYSMQCFTTPRSASHTARSDSGLLNALH